MAPTAISGNAIIEIENFKPEEYWNIYAKLKDPKSKKSFQAKFYGKDNKKIDIHSEDEVNKIVNDVEKAKYIVEKESYRLNE